MYIKENNLELVKVIKRGNDSEKIYKLKNDNSGKFYIELETIPHQYSENIFNCVEYNTIEIATRDANMFLNIREQLERNMAI